VWSSSSGRIAEALVRRRAHRYAAGVPPASCRILLAWAVLSSAVVGLGMLVRRACRARAADGEAWLDFWTGWAALTVVLHVWHFVLPIDARALAFVVSLGAVGLAAEGPRPWRALVRGGRDHPLVVAAVVVAALWLSRQCLAGTRNGDSGSYHIPIMRWLAAYPVVPGLVNLFPFLAYNQSFFAYATLLDVGPLADEGPHLANGLLVLALLGRVCVGLARALDRRVPCSAADLYYALLLPAIFGLGFDINLTSPSPDIAVFALEVVLSGAFLGYLTTADAGGSATWRTAACALLAAAGVTVKLSFAGLAAAVLPLLLVVAVGRATAAGTSRLGAALAVVATAGVAIIPWVAHGIVLSGYPLYPSPLGPVPVDWRAPLAATISQANAIREWNGVAGAWRTAFSDPRWFAGLLGNLGWTRRDVLLPLALAVAAAPVAIVRRDWWSEPPARVRLSPLLLVPTLSGLAFAFVAAPQARFAGALPWILAAQSVLLAVGVGGLGAGRRGRAALAAGAIALAVLHLRDGPLLRRDLVDFEGQPRSQLRDVRLAADLTVTVPVSSDQCWGAPPPCTPAPNRALRLRRAGDLAGGFVIDPAVDPGPP